MGRMLAVVFALVFSSTLITACISSGHPSSCNAACQSSIGRESDRYIASLSRGADAENGTWTKSLTETTCREWTDVMSQGQRMTVARELIKALRAKDQSDESLANSPLT